MRRWQELMKDGLTASQAYYKALETELGIRASVKPLKKQVAIPSTPWLRKVPFAILGLALVIAIIYSVNITGDRNNLRTELETVQSTLTSTQSELSSIELTLVSTQSELSSTEQTLVSTQNELGTTKAELTSTKSELASTENQLTSAQQDSTSLQAILSTTQQQLAVAQETLGGLGITVSATSSQCDDEDFITTGVGLIDNPKATNPTWGQLMNFLSQDQTDKHTYTLGVYDCSLFSRDVHNNAEAAGIRAAEAQVSLRYESTGHALNAFLTTDYGLVYVDCTETDTIARVKAGKEYRAVELDNITGINVRNDYWWDALKPGSYYYISSGFFLFREGHAVTSDIEIFW